jgi:hypothetical protein
MDTLLITLISLFSNLISQIQNFPIQNQQSLNIFLVTDGKMCFNFFLFADTLRSLSFARRQEGESTTWYQFYVNRGITTLQYPHNENLPLS